MDATTKADDGASVAFVSRQDGAARRRAVSPSSWIAAARPHTLSLSITPVVLGGALAWAAEQKINSTALLAALAASMLIQLGTNLHNDAADFERGGDGPERIGPPRATGSGLLSASAVTRGALVCFAMAALLGGYLVGVGGWPILALGLLSLAAGWGYTGGPLPIAYTPLGECFVIAFFGVGAVGGTYYLCTGHFTFAAIVAGLSLGSLTAAVLLVNNYRDAETDARVGRRTLPIVVGAKATSWIYGALMLLPFALIPLLGSTLPRWHPWLALLAMPPAFAAIYRFATIPRGPAFNRILVQTVRIQMLFCALLAAGLVL